jgi:8-amino-7-oxononanoate synthase
LAGRGEVGCIGEGAEYKTGAVTDGSHPPLFLAERLAEVDAAGLRRRPPTVVTADGIHATVDGRDAILLCSNDYLGLRLHPAVTAAAGAAATKYGAGAGSSRMIAGSLPIHDQLEAAIAEWMGTEAALVCSSGYQANLALVGGLTRRGDRVVSDALNHASLIDGCRLSHARARVAPHGDLGAMSRFLAEEVAARAQRFVLGEGLYSMDGDRGDVASWVELAASSGAHVLVDEAHAVGVIGPSGTGVAAEAGVGPQVLARVGTFGKALGAHGAFIAGSRALRELVLNRGRTYIFTTGLPPAAAGAALAALDIVRGSEGDALRGRLGGLVQRFRDGLRGLGIEAGEAGSPIIPVIVGEADVAMRVYEALLQAGIYAMAIRPPTVPVGTCRLRFTLSAKHTDEHVDRALSALESVLPSR